MYLDGNTYYLINKHTNITINDNLLESRPLLTKFKRLILSNMCPVIPHFVLTDALERLNIRINSSMTLLRAGLPGPGYSHILRFRKQIFIHPDDESKIPESIQINFDDTSYWIFPSTDTIKCFVCKKVSHIAKKCQYKPDDATGITISEDQNSIEEPEPNTNKELV